MSHGYGELDRGIISRCWDLPHSALLWAFASGSLFVRERGTSCGPWPHNTKPQLYLFQPINIEKRAEKIHLWVPRVEFMPQARTARRISSSGRRRRILLDSVKYKYLRMCMSFYCNQTASQKALTKAIVSTRPRRCGGLQGSWGIFTSRASWHSFGPCSNWRALPLLLKVLIKISRSRAEMPSASLQPTYTR